MIFKVAKIKTEEICNPLYAINIRDLIRALNFSYAFVILKLVVLKNWYLLSKSSKLTCAPNYAFS